MSLRIGVLASTRGTALQGIIDAIEAGKLQANIALIISNKADAPVLQRAKEHNLPTLVLEPAGRSREAYDEEVTAALRSAEVDIVLMVGYMRIVCGKFVDAWRNRLLNVHPSLLPAFGGLMNTKVHEAVLASGAAETGCTIHQVTEDVDGGAIVLQKRCAVMPGDTAATLKDRVQALEQRAFVEVLQGWKVHERN